VINSSPAPIKTIAGPSEGQTGAFLIARSFRIAVKALFSPADGPDAPGRGITSRQEKAAQNAPQGPGNACWTAGTDGGTHSGLLQGDGGAGTVPFADIGKMPDHHVWSIRPLAQRVTGSEGGFCPRRFSTRLRFSLLIYWEMNRGFPSAPKKPF